MFTSKSKLFWLNPKDSETCDNWSDTPSKKLYVYPKGPVGAFYHTIF